VTWKFPIVIIDEDFRSENTSGLGIRALAEAIEKEGLEVLGVTSYGDLSQFAQQQSRASAFILSIDDEEFTPGPQELDPAMLNLRKPSSRRSASATPTSRSTCTARRAPRSTSRTTSCASCTASSTCSRTRRSSWRAHHPRGQELPRRAGAAVLQGADALRAGRLVLLALPRHSGGVAFLKSPVGQMFHQFFGENMLRADVCNAVEELGQLLDHTGPGGGLERNAARIFNADHCFFVTNGTSDLEQDGLAPRRWRRATSWWSTATATSRSCTRSS
jgi:hypothetical protein